MNTLLRSLFKPQTQKTVPLAVPGDEDAEPMLSEPTPALQGDISAIAIEDVVQLFDFAALTGKLEVHSATNSGTFFFRKGSLIHGLLQINHRRIGQILLDSGVITEQQLEECLLLHERTDTRQRFGQILLEKGYAKSDWLDSSLLRQVKEAFFETLSWHEGIFKFYPGEIPAPDEVQMHARIDHLLLEGMVHIDQNASDEEDE